MELTDEERTILEGAWGPFPAQLMKWMVTFGGAMSARRMVPVDNVLASGISAPANWSASAREREQTQRQVDELLAQRMQVYTTTHVSRVDLERPERRGHPEEIVDYQCELIARSRQAGIVPTWTCAPYLVGNTPLMGEICAWTESSAVVYANTFLGARTNRNGSESAFAAAVLGRVPEYGLLLDDGRTGDFVVEVRTPLETPADWGALGYFAGEVAGLRAPVFTGVARPTQEGAKQLSAALATSGGVSMAHLVGVTPEASTLEAAFGGSRPSDPPVVFGDHEREQTYKSLRDLPTGSDIDYVVLGCPHASLRELFEVAAAIGDRRFAEGVTFIVNASYPIYAAAKRLGYVEVVERAGGEFVVDSCPSVLRWKGGERLITNSFKQAHYQRGLFDLQAAVGVDATDCVEAAVSGRWHG